MFDKFSPSPQQLDPLISQSFEVMLSVDDDEKDDDIYDDDDDNDKHIHDLPSSWASQFFKVNVESWS